MYELTPPTRDGARDRGNESDDNGRESPAQGPPQRESNNEKLMVVLRIRPMTNDERSRGYRIVTEQVDEKMVVLLDPKGGGKKQDILRKKRTSERQYLFDAAFGGDSTQEQVYNKTTKPLVKSVLEGYNACVFAYGATGGGKTHTMVGKSDNPGCMVRALNDLFQAMETSPEHVFKVTMSYLEVYNENIRDLLNPKSGTLDLRDDSKGKNIQVAGLSEIATNSTEEVMRLLQRGNKERTQEPTAANKTSSRSHALLMVNVKQTAKSRVGGKGAVKSGRLYMIDLAGSERASATQNRGKRLKEGAHINRSLLALGNCINALAEGKAKFVNYRDSKLTRLLKDPLSGNCHTVMIAHVSPVDKHRDESRNTLVYADRAKNISNKVRKNVLDVSYHVTQYQNIISDLKTEIGRLKDKMHSDITYKKADKRQVEELKELRDEMVTNFREQMKLRRQLMSIDNHILSLSMEFEKNNIIINEWETEKAKRRHDKSYEKSRRRKKKKSKAKANEDDSPDSPQAEGDEDEEDGQGAEADNEESGFEDDEEGATRSDSAKSGQQSDSKAESELEDAVDAMAKTEDEEAEETGADDEGESSDADNEDNNEEDAEDTLEEPEEVKQAWEELMLVQREQDRYAGIKLDLEQDLQETRKRQKRLEDELPKRISTEEESEILSLLCKVHELEIEKVEMESKNLLKEFEVRRRDLLILKYDKQQSLSNEIIQRQRKLIEGQSVPMPPELMELYSLYQQELQTRETSENDTYLLTEAKEILRTPSMLSLRPELEDKLPSKYSENKLPPIIHEGSGESEKLFRSRTEIRDLEDEANRQRAQSQLSLRSPEDSAGSRARSSPLPPIEREGRHQSAFYGDTGNEFSVYRMLPPIYGYHTYRHPRSKSVGPKISLSPDGESSRFKSKIPRRTNEHHRRRNSMSEMPSQSSGSSTDCAPLVPLRGAKRNMSQYETLRRFPSAPEQGNSRHLGAKEDHHHHYRRHQHRNPHQRHRRHSTKNTDPFQNIGMTLERY
ncbi:kinesin-like protein KIF19 isoform X2 [Tigriopus californicus]|uniref:kinesin-like protein KIF19 isoform X2 n=1 Tax=Tigriopus californicus TaxID=6832 RepID=UPI0027DAA09B|nr:kinesin-like protein KIF19 isoform X2 [Tigriopus californicus]